MLFSLYSGLFCLYLTSFMYLTLNQFLLDSTHLYILHNVLLLTCYISYLLFLLWIYGMLNKITITVTLRIPNFYLQKLLTTRSVCNIQIILYS